MKNPNDIIINKFYLIYSESENPYMYTELKSGKYSKTYNKNEKVISDYISKDEYAAALMNYILHKPKEQ